MQKKFMQWLMRLRYGGEQYFCPLCNTGFSRFLSMGNPVRLNAKCPACKSLERHRLLWVALEHLLETGVLKAGGRLLHMAPESCLAVKFRQQFEYLSADMYAQNTQVKSDITALCFPDESFDVIVCNHVLEHVPDDRKALSELFRVMKYGGWGSIQVPMKGDKTHEDLTITDPGERELLYGQSDHVRQYGEDFRNRLQEAGFDLIELKKEELLGQDELESLSIDCEKSVILARKPLASLYS